MQLGITTTTVSLEAATALVAAAVEESKKAGKNMVIAVTDNNGELKAFARMDGAPLLSLQVAIDKAWTASSFGFPTHGFGAFVDSDAGLKTIAHTPRLILFGGGYPIMIDGQLAGGIGISGGHYTEDMAIAEAALAAVGLA